MSSDQGCPSSRGDGPTEKEGMRVPGCANEGWCGWREKEGKALPARALFSLVAGGAAHPLLLFVPPCPVSAPVAHPRIRASTSTSPSLPSPHGILLIAHRPPRQIPRPIGPFHPPPRPVLLRNTKLPRPEKHCACRQQHLASVAADQESVCVSPQLGAGVCRTLFQIPASGQERGVCVWNLWLHRRPRDTLSRKHRAPLGNHGVLRLAPPLGPH
ncbi:hypothetical protein EDD21DRAFT_375833 [Dissophora ornata]|nr:hypothetical protein EDD21DRAFT_375833 [Dissophora ornata]